MISHVCCADRFAEHREQARLADARLAQQQHGVSRAVARGEPRLRQRGHRALASDVGRETLVLRGLEAVPRAARRLDAEHLDRLGDPLHQVFAEARHFEESGDEPLRGEAHHDGIGQRELLDPRGDVRRVAEHLPLFGAGRAAEVPHQREAGVHRDTHREIDAETRAHAGCQGRDCPHDLEARLHAPARVVLVRDRISEIHDDAVALELRGRSFVAGHDLGACVAVGANEVVQVLRIERPRHLHRAHEIAEHHRHVAPLDQRLGLRRGRRARRRAGGRGKRGSAFVAEACDRRDLGVARRAMAGERRAARRAEFRSVGVLGTAARAVHRCPTRDASERAAARNAGETGPAGTCNSRGRSGRSRTRSSGHR